MGHAWGHLDVGHSVERKIELAVSTLIAFPEPIWCIYVYVYILRERGKGGRERKMEWWERREESERQRDTQRKFKKVGLWIGSWNFRKCNINTGNLDNLERVNIAIWVKIQVTTFLLPYLSPFFLLKLPLIRLWSSST